MVRRRLAAAADVAVWLDNEYAGVEEEPKRWASSVCEMVAQDVWLAVEFASYPRNSRRFFFFSFLRETGGTPHTVLFLEIETKQKIY